MQQHEAVELGKDNAEGFKSRVGLILFGFYSLIYAGFVIVNTWWPKAMETKILLGLNLAVFYGFFLIILAIVMGIIYNHFCTKMEDKLNAVSEEEEK